MVDVAVLATGPSMSQAVADSVRGRCRAVVVSDAWRLAPWADALVSGDAAWWRAHPDALTFAGRRFAAVEVPGVEIVPGQSGINSGLIAVKVAFTYLKARTVRLYGFDMHGDHFFGRHPEPLNNPGERQFMNFRNQFARYRAPGRIINCTPGSALTCFPFELEEACA